MKHIPLLIMAQIMCVPCIEEGIEFNEVNCDAAVTQREQISANCQCGNAEARQQWRGARQWVVPGSNGRRLAFHSFDDATVNPVGEMLDYLLNHGPKNVTTLALAHNGGRYDFHLVLEEIHKRPQLRPKLLMCGLKIYSIEIRSTSGRRVIFKDTLNFFLCPLAALPQTFGLAVQAKPFFPYLFINRANLEKRLWGQLVPEQHHYCPEWMRPAERERFLHWYSEQQEAANRARASGQRFGYCLRDSLLEYCANDVAILSAAVIRYRQLLLANTGMDPFIVATTTAGRTGDCTCRQTQWCIALKEDCSVDGGHPSLH